VQIREIPPRMHARFHASGRTYVYRISCPSSIHNLSVFEINRCWAYEGKLDTEAMAEAAASLLGTHDFSTFRGTGTRPPERSASD
jgi:tRNA pseudouridine38-40 synthase